ncbi:MAG: hypothetical protein KTR30_00855 [Saprospiraceae bacterium]|nr:hypothetical protein [Saprospiraceae bacterium]
MTVSPDTFSLGIEMTYSFQLDVQNGNEAIWISTSPDGERYAHTTREVSKRIDSDSILRYGAIIDRVSSSYKLEPYRRKILTVAINDIMEIAITPDTIRFQFIYYRDSIYFDMWQMKLSVPVKAQLRGQLCVVYYTQRFYSMGINRKEY